MLVDIGGLMRWLSTAFNTNSICCSDRSERSNHSARNVLLDLQHTVHACVQLVE